jgi:hypothetical protein
MSDGYGRFDTIRAGQNLTIGGSSTPSTQLTPGDYYVWGDQAFYAEIGASSVTATTSSAYIPANVLMPFTVQAVEKTGVTGSAQHDYIAVLQVSTGGTAHIIRASR